MPDDRDVVELGALRRVGGRQAEPGVVATELGQPSAHRPRSRRRARRGRRYGGAQARRAVARSRSASVPWRPRRRAGAGRGATSSGSRAGPCLAVARASRPSSAGSSTSRSTDGARNGSPRARAASDRRPQLAVRPREDGTRPVVVRPGAEQALGRAPARRSGPARGPASPGASGRGRITFAKRSRLCSISRTARSTTGAGQR